MTAPRGTATRRFAATSDGGAPLPGGRRLGDPPLRPGELEVRLCDHPRATRQIEVARSGAGLAAFALAALLSHRAGLPTFDAGVRALVAGVVGYVAVWALAVAIWRHLAVAELETARQAAAERRRAAFGGPTPGEDDA